MTTNTTTTTACTITLTRGRLLAALKATLPFACKDPTRFHLASISMEIVDPRETMRFVATDGHTLARTHIATGDITGPHPKQTLLKADDAKSLIKSLAPLAHKRADADRPVTVTITAADGKAARITVTIDSEVLTFDALDAQFPPYAQVIPTYDSEKRVPSLGMNPAYVARACDAITAFGRKTNSNRGAVFSFGTRELDPVLVTFDDPNCGEFLAVIMPMRMN